MSSRVETNFPENVDALFARGKQASLAASGHTAASFGLTQETEKARRELLKVDQ
jgi:hypothetical protein